MRTLLHLVFLVFLPGFTSAQLHLRVSAGSEFIQLPTSNHQRVRSGAVRSRTEPPISFYAGLEVALPDREERFPVLLGVKHGVILGTNLSADFTGMAERCADGVPAGIAPVVAQARLQSTNYWQFYGNVGLLTVPEWRQMTISAGGGLTLLSRQRVHQAVSQINEETGRAEVPTCGFGFVVGEDRALTAVPFTGERLSLGQPMLRPASAYGELLVSFSAGKEMELVFSGQVGLSDLVDETLYGDRLMGGRWFALGVSFRGRVL